MGSEKAADFPLTGNEFISLKIPKRVSSNALISAFSFTVMLVE